MSVAAAINVNSILNRVGVEVGLDAVADPYSSSSQHYIQLKNLLQSACEELVLAHDWEFLVKEQVETIAFDDPSASYFDLPSDFLKIIEQSGWNRTTDEPMVGPLSAQEWQSIVSSNTEPVLRVGFRIRDGKFYTLPNPINPASGSLQLSYEYLSMNFATNSAGDTDKSTITDGGDIILFDRTLITRYLKLVWLQAKGFDTTAAQASVDQVYNFLVGKDKGGRILNVGKRMGYKYIDGTNLPLTGYGQ